MKKHKNLFYGLLCTIPFMIFSMYAPQQPKTYTVSGDVQAWQRTLAVIEQSQASYTEVTAVKAFLIGQIEVQLKAEAKADSLKNQKK